MTPEEQPELEDVEEISETEEVEEAIEEEVEAEEEVTEVPTEAPPEEEEEIVDERIYTVPLRKAYWTGSRLRRAKRAVRILREFVEKHMKPEEIHRKIVVEFEKRWRDRS